MRARREGAGIVSSIALPSSPLCIFLMVYFFVHPWPMAQNYIHGLAYDGYFIADVRYLFILAELLNSSYVLCLEYGFFLTFFFPP